MLRPALDSPSTWLALGAVFILGVMVWIAARSYWDEWSDYVCNLPTYIARHLEKTGIVGLREITLTAPGDSKVMAW